MEDKIKLNHDKLKCEFMNYFGNEFGREAKPYDLWSPELKFIFMQIAKLTSKIEEIKKIEKCCGICKKFEKSNCPVHSANPWSKWKNYCNEFDNIL